jgi:hypothetical protein
MSGSSSSARNCPSQDQLKSQQWELNENLFGGNSPPFQGGVAATIKQNVAKPPCLGVDGVVMNESRSAPFWFVELDNHPVGAAKEREHFLDGAATPPWKRRGVVLTSANSILTLLVYGHAYFAHSLHLKRRDLVIPVATHA